MALVMGANAASIQGGYHDDKGNHISKAEWERQNTSKKMPGFDSYSAAYMGFNDYNPDYQYETSYSGNSIKMDKMSYDYHPMSYAKSVDYQHYDEPKPTYYEDKSYAKPRPM